eukprot:9449247-Alexandrium_andersonii.AAC.1
MSTESGMELALDKLWGVKTFGMFWAAPVCSSWVWVGRSQTARSKVRPEGDVVRPKAAAASRMADHTAVLAV